MYVDPARLTSGPVISQYKLGRLAVARSNVIRSLDALHQRIRASYSGTDLAGLLDEYVALVGLLCLTSGNVAAPTVPGGSTIAAAVSSVARLRPPVGSVGSTSGA